MLWDSMPQHSSIDGKDAKPTFSARFASQTERMADPSHHSSSTHSPSPAPDTMSQPQYAPAATAGGQQNGPVS
jgi:hypothetical protein